MRAASAAACVLLLACASPPSQPRWQPLLHGDTLQGWHNVGRQGVHPAWQAVDGVLVLARGGGGDIASVGRYADFELEFEWQLAPGGNSGVFYRAGNTESAWRDAAEYQLLDDAAAQDRFVPSHRAGAVYDLVAPSNARPHAAGRYNRARIVACGPRVEHWLNGRRVAQYDTSTADWGRRLAASKFAGEPAFAMRREGHVVIQDHGDPVRLRGLRIRALQGCGPNAAATGG